MIKSENIIISNFELGPGIFLIRIKILFINCNFYETRVEVLKYLFFKKVDCPTFFKVNF